tara:strand:- start:120 stop:500 length:381 start_codon:yes stop_codon:yes gene_type:complete
LKKLIANTKTAKLFFDFVSRVAISAIFISSIFSKIKSFDKAVEYISAKGVSDPFAPVLLVGAVICLTLGSGFFIFGKDQKLGSALLLIFLIPTTIIFHLFPLQERAVLMNLGLMGGLILAVVRKPN